MLLRDREHVGLDAAVEQRVRRLLGDVATQAAPLGGPLRRDHVVGREGGGAERADLAGALQVGERGERLLVGGEAVGAVHLVEVDVVGAQAPEARLDLAHDPAPRVAPAVGVALLAHRHVHGAVELGGEDDLVAAALEGLADDLLGLAPGVDVGGVDDVDPGVERGVDDAGALGVVGLAPGAEHHGAEAQRADLHAGGAEGAVVGVRVHADHGRSPPGGGVGACG